MVGQYAQSEQYGVFNGQKLVLVYVIKGPPAVKKCMKV
jgi:hypothetical protein